MNIDNAKGNSEKIEGIIYILIWTSILEMPFRVIQNGQTAFTRRGCNFTNCYVTDQHNFFKDILDFDVIMFNIIGLESDLELPSKRSDTQKYVLVAIEPAGIHKVPKEFNKFFNLTWTYKLDSDVPIPYIVVKDYKDERIGPKREMHWMDIKDMNETNDYVRNKLQKKRIAAAWFASDCDAPSGRLAFVVELTNELVKYGLNIDVFGNCGSKKCPAEDMEQCYALIESTYYFYLAFENSFCEDYVTEKVLTGIEHYAVPVVYGSANYTRFLPDGVYLNAYTLGPDRLAKKMAEITYNKEKYYYDFFKWHGYYSFHYTGEDGFRDEVCGLCTLFNNRTVMLQKTVYRTNLWFNEWHDGPPMDYDSNLKLIIDEENKNLSDISGFVSDVYNYVFE